MKQTIADRLNTLADCYCGCDEALKSELIGLAKLLTKGKEVGSCPYCKRGEFVMVDKQVVNIGEMGHHDCCCADLVIPYWQWIEGDI